MTIIKKTILLRMSSLLALISLNAKDPDLQIKITNNADVPVAFVPLRTEEDSKYNKLYIGSGSSKLSPDAWQSGVANMQGEIGIVVLGPKDSVTVTNASRNQQKYDRVLWVVPLPSDIQGNDKRALELALQTLALAVQNGDRQADAMTSLARQSGLGVAKRVVVTPLEIGSAKTATITGNAKKLDIKTTGKYKEAAKALLQSTKDTLPSTAAAGGFDVQAVLSGTATSGIQKKLGYRETAKTYAKPPTPKKRGSQKDTNKSQAKGAQGDPEGWPSRKDIQTYVSFDKAVKDLKLPDGAVKDLRNYSGLVEKRQGMLNYAREKAQQNWSQSKHDAWLAIKEYAKYHDDIPYGVR